MHTPEHHTISAITPPPKTITPDPANRITKMIILSGGTETAKLLAGMRKVIPEEEITVIVNTAEDTWVSGNLVCPDIDTVLYLFADTIDAAKWWGIRDDTFTTHESLKRAGHHEIMRIGDKDRVTHIPRSDLIRKGSTLAEAIRELACSSGIRASILPMTDHPVATHHHAGTRDALSGVLDHAWRRS